METRRPNDPRRAQMAISYIKDPKKRATLGDTIEVQERLRQASRAHYGIEVRYRNDTKMYQNYVTTYNDAYAIAHGKCHTTDNPTHKTPRYVVLYLLEWSGNIIETIDILQSYSSKT